MMLGKDNQPLALSARERQLAKAAAFYQVPGSWVFRE